MTAPCFDPGCECCTVWQELNELEKDEYRLLLTLVRELDQHVHSFHVQDDGRVWIDGATESGPYLSDETAAVVRRVLNVPR